MEMIGVLNILSHSKRLQMNSIKASSGDNTFNILGEIESQVHGILSQEATLISTHEYGRSKDRGRVGQLFIHIRVFSVFESRHRANPFP